jgi:uncharacterized 2Fe-2S/4Fe-4S cluster protein (DUF4445 family)
MCSITLAPGGKTKKFAKGTLLLDALMDMGAHIHTACGGKGICGNCQIKAEGFLSEPEEKENKIVNTNSGYRLACMSRINGDATVYIGETTASFSKKPYPPQNPDDTYAAAIDIGTTSVTVSLVNIIRKTSIDLASFMNPQRRYGHDVISRISAAADTSVFQKMSNLIQAAILHTMSDALTTLHIPFRNIKHISFAGNTTMLYLLFGIDVSPLGKYPYSAYYTDFLESELTKKRISKPIPTITRIFPNAQISALPAVSGFLGGDFTGGLSLCFGKGFTKNTFFIDLGTNGELFFINESNDIYAASCAMGPALEGMNISWGMTADDGAVTHVWLESGKIRYSSIGNGLLRGITGTALVDILALFLELDIIDPNGAFCKKLENRKLPDPASYETKSNPKKIRLWGDIAVTQKDIRNVQLAKGASLAASNLLLKKAGSSSKKVEHVLIAGALGENLSMSNFKKLAFLPGFPNAKYHYLGNTSLTAARQACLDEHFIKNTMAIRDRVHEVNLSRLPEFTKEFMKALSFG